MPMEVVKFFNPKNSYTESGIEPSHIQHSVALKLCLCRAKSGPTQSIHKTCFQRIKLAQGTHTCSIIVYTTIIWLVLVVEIFSQHSPYYHKLRRQFIGGWCLRFIQIIKNMDDCLRGEIWGLKPLKNGLRS